MKNCPQALARLLRSSCKKRAKGLPSRHPAREEVCRLGVSLSLFGGTSVEDAFGMGGEGPYSQLSKPQYLGDATANFTWSTVPMGRSSPSKRSSFIPVPSVPEMGEWTLPWETQDFVYGSSLQSGSGYFIDEEWIVAAEQAAAEEMAAQILAAQVRSSPPPDCW